MTLIPRTGLSNPLEGIVNVSQIGLIGNVECAASSPITQWIFSRGTDQVGVWGVVTSKAVIQASKKCPPLAKTLEEPGTPYRTIEFFVIKSWMSFLTIRHKFAFRLAASPVC
jgi:hypothetical protein